MAKVLQSWIEVRSQGIFCIPGNFYVDPISPVECAIVTHGHSDHACPGHQKVLATTETLAIMQSRYASDSGVQQQALAYHEKIQHNQVKIYLLPAGHILGSAQVVMEYAKSRIIISGDYKRAFDPTCESFMVENCDHFITEATFGLPIFKHPLIEHELEKLLNSLRENSDRCHLISAYALGKTQRIIKTLRQMNYTDTIYLHGAQIKLCELYQRFHIDLGDIQPASLLDKKNSAGKIIICPPSALHDRWSRRFADVLPINASGWMQIRARAKQKKVELPLVISDHADWLQLTNTIKEVNAEEVWVTHGREEALTHFAINHGYKARALSLLGYDESNED